MSARQRHGSPTRQVAWALTLALLLCPCGPAILGAEHFASAARPSQDSRSGPPAIEDMAPLPPPLAGVGQATQVDEAWTFGSAGVRPISFADALQIASAQNPQIAAANQRIAEAYAQLRGAEALWLPAIRAGVSHNRHDGPLQGTDGAIVQTDRWALQPGLGVGAVGSGSPAVPGVALNVRLTDAVYQPRIAGHAAAASQNAARATTHDLLLSTGLAYLELLRAYQQQAIAKDTLQNAQQLADLTTSFARVGQGAQSDADRARVELVLRQNEIERTNEATQVASVRLVELLHMDPMQLVAPTEPVIVPVEFVSQTMRLDELIPIALRNRPELAESQQLVCEAINRLRRERYAPILPSMLLGVSYSDFGGGRDSQFDQMSGRFDMDAAVYWEIRGLGVGEAAARGEARARLQQRQMQKIQVMDRVAREVAEGYSQIHARHKQIRLAQSAIQAATDSFRRNDQRIHEGQGLPIEVLQSIQALDQARREYLRAVSDYDESQFRLYRAIGCALGNQAAPSPD